MGAWRAVSDGDVVTTVSVPDYTLEKCMCGLFVYLKVCGSLEVTHIYNLPPETCSAIICCNNQIFHDFTANHLFMDLTLISAGD